MLSGLSAGAVALVLLAGFAGHLRHPRTLPRALAAHRTVPRLAVWPIAITMTALEGLCGASTGYALLFGTAGMLVTAVLAGSVLLGGYALYGLYVLRSRPRVPCGCASDDTPMSGWVAGRAGALALAGLGAAAGAGPATDSHGAHLTVVALASVVFATLLWLLPTAMNDPDPKRRTA